MKEKIFAVLTALMVLASTTGLWFSHKGTITVSTDLKPKTEVVLQYRKKAESKLISVKKKTEQDGKAFFHIKGQTLYYFKIDLPEKTEIKNVQFRGWKNQTVALNAQNEYTGKFLNNRIHITNWYNLIVLGGLGYYLGWFLTYSLKYGFPKDDPKPPKYMNIEFLRIVFTFIILFFHMLGAFNFFSFGRYSVEFFFILSGFLFCLTYKNTSSICDFMKKKIIRFTPLIVFCSVICGVFQTDINFSTMTGDWFFLGSTGLFGNTYTIAAWYLSVIFWVTSFYFYLLKTQRKETVYIIMAVLTFFSYVALARFQWGDRLPGLGDKENIGYMITQGLMHGVANIGLGFFIGLFYLNRIPERNLFKPWQYTIAEGFLLIFSCVGMLNKKIFPDNPLLLIISFGMLIYLFVIRKGYISCFFEKPVFSKISKYILAIYLSHQPVTFSILKYFKILPSSFSYPSDFFIICIFLILLLSFIIHHTIELPATRVLKKWLG